MLDFKQNSEQTGIEPWPSLADSGANILSGDPQQSGRLDFGTFDGPLMSGVWECTPGKFEISYPWGELATILKGSITVTDSDGRAVTYAPGDSFFVAQGQRVTWEIHEPVRKCFFIHVAKAESAAAE